MSLMPGTPDLIDPSDWYDKSDIDAADGITDGKSDLLSVSRLDELAEESGMFDEIDFTEVPE